MDHYIDKGYYIHSKKLGEGGFGVVKLATHHLTKQKVAIKIIDKEKIKKDLFRVRNEIAALQKLRHDNIAKLYQIIENNQYIFLIMEYCSGGELFDYLVSRSRLSEPEAQGIIRSLISVLAFIHRKGIAHRDIKPENILLDDNQNIKLIDFGLCAYSHSSPNGNLEGLSTCCGSPAYVAPELLLGNKYSGPPADIWSTGVLLYALLSGRLPFNNPNLALLYKSIKEGQYEMPHLSSSAQDLISKMLCVDPAKRITIQQIIEHRWMNTPNPQWVMRKKMLAEETLKDENDLDEKILLKCSTLFPDLDLNTLRENIQNKNGYHSATYWIVKERPELYQDFDHSIHKESINRRRSRSFSEFNSHKIKKLTKDDKVNNNIDVDNIENSDKLKKFKFKDIRYCPKTEMKDKKNLHLVTVTEPVKGELRTRANNNKHTINRKLFNGGTPTTVSKNVAKNSHELSPILPSPPSISSHYQGNNKENITVAKNNEMKAPNKLKVRSLEDQLRHQPQTSTTPKKSLLKWIMESATPRKTSIPRYFSANDRNSKNAIITEYKNPDECIEKIVKILREKQVNCKAKNFVIRCVLSTMNVIILAFELEILICRNTGRVAIQHKRIRGTSWDYIKMCDDIKRELDKALQIKIKC